jgi:DNA-binding NarL/FixJ family response regulator
VIFFIKPPASPMSSRKFFTDPISSNRKFRVIPASTCVRALEKNAAAALTASADAIEKQPELTAQEKSRQQEIKKLALEGLPTTAIAEKLSCTERYVQNIKQETISANVLRAIEEGHRKARAAG